METIIVKLKMLSSLPLIFVLSNMFTVSCSQTEIAENIQKRDQQIDVISNPNYTQKEGQDMDSVFGLAITVAADMAITIEVNGVPFTPKEAGNLETLSIPIQGEVLPGKNILDVVIGTADASPYVPLESIAVTMPDKSSIDISLQLDKVTEPEPGKYVTQVEDLEVLTWNPVIKDGKIRLPQKLSLEFTAPSYHPLPTWAKAETRSVSELESALTEAHRDIISALKSGDANKVGRMSVIAYQEAATAYPIGGDANTRQESDVAEIKDIISDVAADIPAFPEPLTCKGYAQNRLFECFAKDGEAPVRILFPGEDPIYFTFRFSVIDGKLRIVR
ncbi:hypothetical protein N9M10_02660 [Hellea sp.]|nr:hypothetical protein [Hellea sp.]